MHKIETKTEFFHWAATAIRAGGVQVQMPVGLLRSYNNVFRHMDDKGSFSIGAARSTRAATLGAPINNARQQKATTETASAAVSYFLGDVYACAMARKGTMTLRTFVRAVGSVLKLAPMDLRIEDGVLRRSPAS